MQVSNALAMLALGGAIVTDVAGTFAMQHAARQRDRPGSWRRWGAAVGAFVVSLALFAFALAELPTAVAEALFVAIGSGAVALIAARRGESITTRTSAALALLVLGVVVLQTGAGHA